MDSRPRNQLDRPTAEIMMARDELFAFSNGPGGVFRSCLRQERLVDFDEFLYEFDPWGKNCAGPRWLYYR